MAKKVIEKTVTKTVTKENPVVKNVESISSNKISSSSKPQVKSSLGNISSIDKALIENFIALQKVMTNVSVKFDDLSGKISKLLEVFEISAKSLAEKDFKDFIKVNDKEVLEKLDSLLEQNKIIAKGLIMIHDKTTQGQGIIEPPLSLRQKSEYRNLTPMASPNPNFNQDKRRSSQNPESNYGSDQSQDMSEYTKSIAPPREG